MQQRDGSLRQRLWDNVKRARAGLEAAGFRLGAHESPIVSIEVGTADAAVRFWRMLLERGVYVNVVLPPACRPESCLLRTSYTSAHSADQIDRAVSALAEVGRSLSIVPVVV